VLQALLKIGKRALKALHCARHRRLVALEWLRVPFR
jgi:hypothetical protein